mgnify:FL=1
MEGYEVYECPPCGGDGLSHDPTLTDNVHRTGRERCPFCDGYGVVYVLAGFPPPRYAGKRIGA